MSPSGHHGKLSSHTALKGHPPAGAPLWQGPAEQRSLLTPLKFQASLLGLLQIQPESKRGWEELGPWRRTSSPPVMLECVSALMATEQGLQVVSPLPSHMRL